jgi:Ras GTPase-activating-like protein IQGAP2/3
MDRQSILASYGIPLPVVSRSTTNTSGRRTTLGNSGNRTSKRYSVTALYSMAAEQDVEVEDDLAKCK